MRDDSLRTDSIEKSGAMRWSRFGLILFLVIVAAYNAFSHTSSVARPKYRIVGYVTGRTNIYSISVEKLTHINYAFANVSADGQIFFKNADSSAHLSQLQALKSKNPALKIIISIGGWGADNFSDAALTNTSRDKFAGSAVDLIKLYALDGIDLDWEYPGQPGPGIKFRAEDKENFSLLLKTIRQRLDALSDERKRVGDDRYTLTIASSDGEYFNHTEMGKLHAWLDWINIMSYDLYSSNTSTTGHHTGLYASASGPEFQRNTESSVKQHLSAGIPANKLVVGVAFYGRGWTEVNAKNNGLFQPYGRFVKAYSYSELVTDYINKHGYKRYWDAAAKAPYLWNPDSNSLISYDDPESIKAKTSFVKARQLGGIMYWEHSNDPDEVLLTAIFESLK